MTPAVSSLLTVLGLWIVLAVFCCASADERQITPNNGTANSHALITVSAPTLISDYEANEVSADGQYKDKIIAVTGQIDAIGKDVLDDMYITLSSGQEFGIVSVQCMFDESHRSKLSRLRKGQTVTVVGRCSGKLGNVLLRNCELP